MEVLRQWGHCLLGSLPEPVLRCPGGKHSDRRPNRVMRVSVLRNETSRSARVDTPVRQVGIVLVAGLLSVTNQVI